MYALNFLGFNVGGSSLSLSSEKGINCFLNVKQYRSIGKVMILLNIYEGSFCKKRYYETV